jgi:hypothetical protein
MDTKLPIRCLFAAMVVASLAPFSVAELPTIPVGLDAYRQWDRWSFQRIGSRAYMRSTYDRAGNNEGADASHFLYQLADDFNVTLDVEGPGILCFVRTNHWHGSPWHYVVDGKDHIVQETSTADPNKPVPNSVFLPAHLFPNPLTWTWSITKGADLNWVPMPFENSFQMAYSRTRYGTGYYIYQQFIRGTPLSQPIKAWDGQTPPDKDVLELIGRAGTDIAPNRDTEEGRKLGVVRLDGSALTLKKDATVEVKTLVVSKPTMLRALEFSIPREQAVDFGRVRLRVTWDERSHPSIDAPVALFFGAGTLYNRDGREFLVKAFPVNIRYDAPRVHLACYFPMPFFKGAKIELLGNGATDLSGIAWSVRHHPFDAPPSHVGYFHATYQDHAHSIRGEDLVLLDTRKTEGGGDWSGSFVGTSFIFSDRAVLSTLEGDPRFFFDDSQSPQGYGTGTEEWGGGGDYWGGVNMTLPFAGHPVGARDAKSAQNEEDKIQSAYRFLLGDLFPFGKNARIQLEHGGENESVEHYRTVTYWYGAPRASLVKTDELKIGDAASEKAHGYLSPAASAPYEITSRYELGPDRVTSSNAPADAEPLAKPEHFAEFAFETSPGTYTIWVRGRALQNDVRTDASWLQFDDDIGTKQAGVYSHPKAFGNWLDRSPAGTWAWSSALPQETPRTITFERGGKHRLRLQPRHAPHQISTIWLSASRKDLPPPNMEPARGPGEIVINSTDALSVHGAVKTIADATTGEQHALDIHSPATAQETHPPHTDYGRKTTGTSEFTLKLEPQNLGVILRRKLDYQFPNQRAEVYVADANATAEPQWKPAGVWYLAGSNTCIYSNPKEELGATQHNVQTSNRRFREDEFLVPRDLTAGRAAVRVRVKFTPVTKPLLPGHPLAELAWSEIRYDAYCVIVP